MNKNVQNDFFDCSVAEYFAGKTVIVTGATGFLGTLLVESLLRKCPDIKSLFLLIRQKKGITSDERLKKMISLPLFGNLRETQPDAFKKLKAITFDLQEKNGNLDDDACNLIRKEANIIFHTAATVKFNEHLRLSYKINTQGLRNLLRLCRSIENLSAFVHVSTAYSYCNRSTIGEEVYENEINHYDLYASMQEMNDDAIAEITPDVIKRRPNTYTLTKAFGEEVIVKEGEDLPVCIVRPTVIGATWKEPVPGWCVNLSGATGSMIALGKGLLRVLNSSKQDILDVVPADFVVNATIAAAWKIGRRKTSVCGFGTSSGTAPKFTVNADNSEETKKEIEQRPTTNVLIYNISSRGTIPTLFQLSRKALHAYTLYPLDNALWFPGISFIPNKGIHRIFSVLFHFLPACLYDLVRLASRKKPLICNAYKQLDNMTKSLHFFWSNRWKWKADNLIRLSQHLCETDKKDFNFDITSVDWDVYVTNYCRGTREYILKESPRGYPAARRHHRRLGVLKTCVKIFALFLLYRLLARGNNAVSRLFHFFVFQFLQHLPFLSTYFKNY